MPGKSAARQMVEEEVRDAVAIATGVLSSKYSKAFDRRANGLALLGYSNDDIADHFGIERNTVAAWIVEHQSFKRAIEKARVDAHVGLVRAMHKAGRGFKARETKVFSVNGKLETLDVTKHYPPSVQAATLVLTNRDPKRWQDKSAKGNNGLEALPDLLEAIEAVAKRRALDLGRGKVLEGTAESVDEPGTPDVVLE